MNDPGLPSVIISDERSDPDVDVDLDTLAVLMAKVLHSEGISGRADTSLTLIDPGTIAEMKAEFLDGDGEATDVLSFPIDGRAEPGDPIEPWMVGDVVLCPSVAAAQSSEHTGNLIDELALLVIHGSLHLVGWDHVSESERDLMWQRERELMDSLHRIPERDPWSTEQR